MKYFILCFNAFQLYIGHHYRTKDLEDKYSPGSTTVSPPVSKIIVHEDFTKAENIQKKLNKYYDLALLELSEDVDLATFTPACLARASDLTTFDNKMALATGKNPSTNYISCSFFLGWGKLDWKVYGFSSSLQEVKLKVTPVKINNGTQMTIRQTEFGVKRSPDLGDSGGPLTYLHNGQHTLIGVTSAGFK